jgi:hypothetical protein
MKATKAMSPECHRIEEKLKGFDEKKSQGVGIIEWKYGSKRSKEELLIIAEWICAQSKSSKPGRDEKRRRTMLMKWFDSKVECLKALKNQLPDLESNINNKTANDSPFNEFYACD